tara:strand:- start:185 stop:724 length:540 start_codon:yes stop_codon:yes gene_type:complete
VITIIEKIIKNYNNNTSLYIGEDVTISEHMIQSAMLAEKNNSTSNLVCSSLLHDYGHLILENPDEMVSQKKDDMHEMIGYNFLKNHFIEDVVEPIKNHVKAKRYLARNNNYYQILSQASKVSLNLQGGVMKDDEAKEFEKEKYFQDSIKLRRFDEGAKKIGLKVKSIEDYKDLLISKLS